MLGGAGVLAIGVSSIMTLSARSKYNDAIDAHCGGMKTTCDDDGLTLTHDARSTANTATFIFIAGTAAVAGGVALYILAPKGEATDDSTARTARYVVPGGLADERGRRVRRPVLASRARRAMTGPDRVSLTIIETARLRRTMPRRTSSDSSAH